VKVYLVQYISLAFSFKHSYLLVTLKLMRKLQKTAQISNILAEI
jgi:hypothetical protein